LPGVSIEIVVVLALVLANGLFAMAEIAVVSARKARLRQRAEEGDAKARIALSLADAPGDFLSTTQVGITLIGTLAGAFGGATIAVELSAHLARIPLLAAYSHPLAIGVVVLAITYLSLILGELAPKRVALNNPEGVASALAPSMRLLAKVARPVVVFLSWSTSLVLRLLPLHRFKQGAVTSEEIKALVEEGTQAGTVEESEQELVHGVFRLGDRRVVDVMTPHLRVAWLDVAAPPGKVAEVIRQSGHSRLPVCQGTLDKLLGVVHVKDLFSALASGGTFDLRTSLRQPLLIPEDTEALMVLERFRESGTHIGVVVDEHGGVLGLVTLKDILEAIVGDLPPVGEPAQQGVVQREDGSWLADGMLPVADLKDLFELRKLPLEDEGTFSTLGGFVMAYLGRVPAPADHFECDGVRFEVMDMDGNRVDKVLVQRLPKEPL
jgi:putative hemolysin